MDPTARVSLHGRIKPSPPSDPPCSNLRPVKAVRHGGSGWVASEGERGSERDRAGNGKEQFVVEKSGWLKGARRQCL